MLLFKNLESSDKSIRLQVAKSLTERLQFLNDERAIETAIVASECSKADLKTMAYFALGKLDEALASCTETYENPTLSSTKFFYLARIAMGKKDLKTARRHIRRYAGGAFSFLSRDPGIPARLANGYAWASLFSTEQPQEAMDAALDTMQARPNHALAHTIAALHASRKEHRQAVESLGLSIDLNPWPEHDLDDDLVLGKLAENLGLLAEAKFYYQRCMNQESRGMNSCKDLATLWSNSMEAPKEDDF